MGWLIVEKVKSISEIVINALVIVALSLIIIGLVAMVSYLRDVQKSEETKPKVVILAPDTLGSINGVGNAISPRPQPKKKSAKIGTNDKRDANKYHKFMRWQLQQSLFQRPYIDPGLHRGMK
jgi:hypothetical protein